MRAANIWVVLILLSGCLQGPSVGGPPVSASPEVSPHNVEAVGSRTNASTGESSLGQTSTEPTLEDLSREYEVTSGANVVFLTLDLAVIARDSSGLGKPITVIVSGGTLQETLSVSIFERYDDGFDWSVTAAGTGALPVQVIADCPGGCALLILTDLDHNATVRVGQSSDFSSTAISESSVAISPALLPAQAGFVSRTGFPKPVITSRGWQVGGAPTDEAFPLILAGKMSAHREASGLEARTIRLTAVAVSAEAGSGVLTAEGKTGPQDWSFKLPFAGVDAASFAAGIVQVSTQEASSSTFVADLAVTGVATGLDLTAIDILFAPGSEVVPIKTTSRTFGPTAGIDAPVG